MTAWLPFSVDWLPLAGSDDLAAAYDALPATPGLAVELNLGPWAPPDRMTGDWVHREPSSVPMHPSLQS